MSVPVPWYSDSRFAAGFSRRFTSSPRATAIFGQSFRHQFSCSLLTTDFWGVSAPTQYRFVDQGGFFYSTTNGLTLSDDGLLSGTVTASSQYQVKFLKVKALNWNSGTWQNHVFTLRIIPSDYTVQPFANIDQWGYGHLCQSSYFEPENPCSAMHPNAPFCDMGGLDYRQGFSEDNEESADYCDRNNPVGDDPSEGFWPQEALFPGLPAGVWRQWLPQGKYVMRARSGNGATIYIENLPYESVVASEYRCDALAAGVARQIQTYSVPAPGGSDVIFDWNGGMFEGGRSSGGQGNHFSNAYDSFDGGPAQSQVAIYFYEDLYGPVITSPPSRSGKVGSMLTHQIIAGGAQSFSMQGAPNWVKIDTSTGVVRAIPPAVGAYTWTLRVTGGGQTTSQTFTFNVGAPDTPVVQSALFELPLLFVDGDILSELAGFPVDDSYLPLWEEAMYEELIDGDGESFIPPIYQPTPFVLAPASYFNPNPILTGFTLSQSVFSKANHGLKNGTEIVFTDLGVSETKSIFDGGLSRNYRYYVINATADSFGITVVQLAVGGETDISVEITETYSDIKIQIWDRKGNTYAETHYWSPAVLLSSVGQTLGWSGFTSSNTDFAGLQTAGSQTTVSFPRATTVLGPTSTPPFNPPRNVSYTEPGVVSISAGQAGNSTYQPVNVKLTWGKTPFDNSDHLILFTIPAEIAVDQEAGFSVVSNKGLTPIFVESDDPSIIEIIGAGPGGLFVGGQTKIKGNLQGDTLIIARQAGNDDVGEANDSVFVRVGRKTQVITFNVPPVVWEEGMEVVLTASSNSGLPVTLKSSNGNIAFFQGNTLIIKNQGSVNLIAEQNGNGIWAPAQVIRNIGIGSRNQTIYFNEFGVVRYGDPSFEIEAYSNSELPLILTSDAPGVASISFGTALQINGVGSATITASQPGDAFWRPAAPVSRVVTISRGIPVITATVPSSIRVGPAYRVELTGVSSNSAPVRFFAASGSSSVLKVVEESGRYFVEGLTENYGTVFATVDISTFYEPATVRFSILVGRAPQSISGETFFIRKFSDKYLEPKSKATSFLPVTYQIVSGPGSVSGDRINFTGVGVIVVNAFQSGNGEFKPSDLYRITVAVEKGVQSVLFPPLVPVLIGGSQPLSAQAEGGGSVQFYSSSPSVVSVAGNVATGVTLGTVFILALTSGNSNYEAAAMVQPLTVVAGLSATTVTNPTLKDPESFSAFSISPNFIGQAQQISRLPVDDEETHASTSLSSSTATPPSSIARTVNDSENFNSPVQSSEFTGASFELVDYPGRGDAEVAFLSFVPSANSSGDCFDMQGNGVRDTSEFSSLAISPAANAENCVIARFNLLEEFEPYTSSWPIPPNGFIVLLSGSPTSCISNWTDWLPAVSTVCSGEQFIQSRVDLSGCSNVEERLAVGTKPGCSVNCISDWTIWTPSRYTVCQGVQFTQSRTDLNGCLPVQTRMTTGLNGGDCTATYTFRVNIIAIDSDARSASPPCPRVNTWAVGGAVSDFWTTPGVRTQVYTYSGVAGVDIFVWDNQFIYQAATGNPVIEWQPAGTGDQQKLQIRYSTAGIYDIDVQVMNTPYRLVIDQMKVSYPNSNYFSAEANAIIPVPSDGTINTSIDGGWFLQAKIDLLAGKIIEFRLTDGRLIWDINANGLAYPKVEGSLTALGLQTARIRPGDCDLTLKYDEEQTLDTTLGGPGDFGSDTQRLSSGEVRLESASNV